MVAAPLPPGTFLHAPTLSVARHVVYLSGVPTAAGRSDAVPSGDDGRQLVRVASGSQIGTPTGRFRFLNARLLGDHAGRLHLIWGEPGPSDTIGAHQAGMPWLRAKSLWHATFTSGAGWSAARPSHGQPGDRGRLLWNVESAGVGVSPAGRVDVVVPQVNGELLHFGLDGDRWRADTIHLAAREATMAEGGGGQLYVALVGVNGADARYANGLVFLRSPDGGKRWEPPVNVQPREMREPTRPRVFVGVNGTVQLLWGTRASATFGADAVRAMSSADGGHRWSTSYELPLPREQFTKWRAALDSCGTPRVVVSTWVRHDSIQTGRLFHSVLRGDGWAPLSPLMPERDAREVEVATGADGKLYLVASARQAPPSKPPRYDVILSTVEPIAAPAQGEADR